MVSNINEDEESYPHSMAVLRVAGAGDRLFFAAEGDRHGKELWTSDGTGPGTMLLKDINPGDDHSYVQQLVACGDLLFLCADDGEHGFELWRSDGTASGTMLVADLTEGAADSPISSLECERKPKEGVRPLLKFTMGGGAAGALTQWESDGTAANTKRWK